MTVLITLILTWISMMLDGIYMEFTHLFQVAATVLLIWYGKPG